MKIQLFIILSLISLLSVSCASIKENIAIRNSNLIQAALSSEHISAILDLKSATKPRPIIYLVDKTKTFKNIQSGTYLNADTTVFVPYYILDYVPSSLNTGHTRDLILVKYSTMKNEIKMDFNIATFRAIDNQRTNYFVWLQLKKKSNNTFEVISSEISDYTPTPPPIEY